MQNYNFIESDINKMYDNVCNESCEKIHKVMDEINNSHLQITEEQNARFEKIYDSIAITITIGSHTITIPNNADNINIIFKVIQECQEQTI